MTVVQTCALPISKRDTYNFFEKKIKTPKILEYKDIDEKDFPVFIKPNIGQGSKGANIVINKTELDFIIKKNQDLIITEYLPGKEYTIDCFTNKKGKLIFSEGRERLRISNGISVNTIPVINKEFKKLAKIINNNIDMRGAWFFQLKENKKNELCLLEIAPRIAGTMSLYRNIGINLPLLSIFDFLNKKINIILNPFFPIEEDRALFNRFSINLDYSVVYIDLDDTILFNKKINPFVIQFIYQSINKNKKIILITRHSNDLNKTLKKYRISQLFEKKIVLNKNKNKSDFIKYKKSIFIDDSFSERQEVIKKCKIPTFDTHSIECLIDFKY